MGVSWQSPIQKAFIEGYVASYTHHSGNGTLKTEFWPVFFEKWFEAWPVPTPGPDFPGGEEAARNVMKEIRCKRIAQLKRALKGAGDDSATAGRRNLHLSSGPPRKRSEVQVYMSLYYDTRIRPVVVKEWTEAKIPNMDFSRAEVPEEDVDPEDSSLFKDTRIPLCFKNNVAQRLYDAEEEEVKVAVKAKREAEAMIKTVYNTSGEDRQELVLEYQRNYPSMGRNMSNVLKNAERRFAAKGIIWLASPAPSAAGKPVGHFHCGGITPDMQDFETFIGADKAKEFRLLFTNWIYAIYPESDWHLFSSNTSVTSTSTTTTGGGPADDPADDLSDATPGSSTSSLIPKSPALSLMPKSTPSLAPELPAPSIAPGLSAPSNQLDVTSGRLGAAESVVEPDNLDLQPVGHPTPIPDPVRPPSLDFLAGITDEPGWMRKKRTLDYFRGAFKLGDLPMVIENWYELERILGFPATTPAGFRTTKRPAVIRLFYQNAHNYRKDYKVEVHALGRQIMEWWAEISPFADVPCIAFGGPTGIYSLVVLLSWWCALLKTRPVEEHTDCLRTLTDIGRDLSRVVTEIRNVNRIIAEAEAEDPVTSTSMSLSPTSPPPPSQSRKRANPGEASSRKRARSGKV